MEEEEKEEESNDDQSYSTIYTYYTYIRHTVHSLPLCPYLPLVKAYSRSRGERFRGSGIQGGEGWDSHHLRLKSPAKE